MIMLCETDLALKFVDETLVCDYSNESYWAVLSCGTVYYALQGGSNCGWNPNIWLFKWKLLNSTFMWYCLLTMLYKVKRYMKFCLFCNEFISPPFFYSFFFNSCSWTPVVTYWISRTNKSGLTLKRYRLHSSHLGFFCMYKIYVTGISCLCAACWRSF